MRRVCCASTRLRSISRGWANASRIAGSVISLKVTRWVFEAGTWAASATCQAIASPSRSRSVARKTESADFAAFAISGGDPSMAVTTDEDRAGGQGTPDTEPEPAAEPEADLEIDEDFLRRIREV